MKSLKKTLAVTLAAVMTLSTAMWTGAAEVSKIYNKTYIEFFDDAEKIFGDDGIIEYGQNATAENVTVEETKNGGKYLQVVSGGSDVQLKTKKGMFKHDVTVIDMNISAVLGTQPFPLVRLVNNGAKMDTGNGLFRFVNSNKAIRSYNQTSGSYDSVSLNNEWVNVRIILDSVAKTVTTSFNGSQVTTVSQMANEWSNSNVQILFQAAAGSTVKIGDIIISDGFHMENVYMTQDFEHSGTVNGAVGNGYFYNISKTQNPTVTYDAESNNTYLDITNAASNLIYTASTINTIATPVVVEFDMKATSVAGSAVSLKRSSNKAITPLFNEDKLIADGTFHRYRATVSPLAAGYKVVMLVDNVYKGYYSKQSGAYCGTDARLEILSGASSADMAIDNLRIFYPQSPKLVCNFENKTDVAVDTTLELVSNTQINATTAPKATITANGVPVNFTTSSNGAKNSYIYNIEGGLKKGTTYVITTGEAGVRDYFDQYYNDTITFTTVPEDIEASFEYALNGEVPSDGKFKAGDAVSVVFNLKSNTPSGASGYGYIAYYGDGNILLSVQPVSLSVAESGTDSDTTGTISVPSDVESIKIMLWDINTKPLTGFVELTK